MSTPIVQEENLTISLEEENSITVSGEVVVIDPCYLFNDDVWQKIVDTLFCSQTDSDKLMLRYNSVDILCVHTAEGDGAYDVDVGFTKVGEVAVDSGMICCFSLSGISEKDTDFLEKVNSALDDELATKTEAEGVINAFAGGMLIGAVSCDTRMGDTDDLGFLDDEDDEFDDDGVDDEYELEDEDDDFK